MPERKSVKLLDPATLSKLEGLELRARSIVEGYIAGVHRSPYHGFSIEFAQHREYAAGDDLRYVDWKVFAKRDKIYVKQYEDETNLACYLLLDTSESMRYQGPAAALSKFGYAQCLAAALAHLIIRQRDRVGLVTFDHKIGTLVWPASSTAHLKRLLGVMEQAAPSGRTGAGPLLHDLAERIKKPGVVVVIGDLLDDVAALLSGLKHFRHRGHEVIIQHVLDRAELDFPFQQVTMFRGLEQLPDVLTEPQTLRTAYLRALRGFLHQVQAGIRALGADYVLIPTDRPLDLALSSYLASRLSRPT
jgi:uncharacterized protein (DUF58 family)